MLEAVLEPIILGRETDQHSGRSPVSRDDDFFFSRLPEVLGQVILHLR